MPVRIPPHDVPTCPPGTVPSSAHRCVPITPQRRADALACEVKEEVTANGRRRGTFARKGIHPAPQEKRTHAQAASTRAIPCQRGYHTRTCPTCPPGTVPSSAHRCVPITPARRADALACEVKEEVTANGRRRGTFARKGIHPAPQEKRTHAQAASTRAIPCQRGYHTRTCPTCLPGTVPSSAHRCVPTAPARRVDALACEVKEEVTATGRRRGTFARKGIHPAPHGKTHIPARRGKHRHPETSCA